MQKNSIFFEEFIPRRIDWIMANQNQAQDLKNTKDQIKRSNLNIQFICLSQESHVNSPESLKEQKSIQNDGSQSTQSSHETRQSSRKVGDNKKNTIPYISKKICEAFLSKSNGIVRIVKKICSKTGCLYQAAINFYQERSKEVFGVKHLSYMINLLPEEDNHKIKKAFRIFQKWYLRRHYLNYVVKQGKMQQKVNYLKCSTKYFLYIGM